MDIGICICIMRHMCHVCGCGLTTTCLQEIGSWSVKCVDHMQSLFDSAYSYSSTATPSAPLAHTLASFQAPTSFLSCELQSKDAK